MRNLNGKLKALESLASIFSETPAYSDDVLRTWSTALEFSDLVHTTYNGDRGSAIGDLANWDRDLRVKFAAQDWGILAHLGPLVSDEGRSVPDFRDEFLWALGAVIDIGFENGGTVAELSQAAALFEAMQMISDILVEVKNDEKGQYPVLSGG